MIKITNGTSIIVVTNGAYRDIYKYHGYRPLNEVVEAKEAADAASKAMHDHGLESDKAEAETDATVVPETPAKPLEQWSKQECHDFVKTHGIDTGSAKSVTEVKKIIADWMLAQAEAE